MQLSIRDESPGFSVLVAAFDGLALVVIFLTFSERNYNFNEFSIGQQFGRDNCHSLFFGFCKIGQLFFTYQ